MKTPFQTKVVILLLILIGLSASVGTFLALDLGNYEVAIGLSLFCYILGKILEQIGTN